MLADNSITKTINTLYLYFTVSEEIPIEINWS